MKKQPLALVALLAGGLFASSAFAADGTISISGEINGTTCSISGGTGPGPGTSPNFAVPLQKVQASALAAIGQTAGATPFFITVGGAAATCPDGTVVAVLYESSSPAISPATGNLTNQATGTPATHVEVQIVDAASNAPVDLRKGVASTSATVTGGTVTLPFSAQYVATGAATAGPVSTSVMYSVTFP